VNVTLSENKVIRLLAWTILVLSLVLGLYFAVALPVISVIYGRIGLGIFFIAVAVIAGVFLRRTRRK
jgi:hypothetical protein